MMNDNDQLNEYEAERAARVAANRARLAALGVLDAAAGFQAAVKPSLKVPQRRKEKKPKAAEEDLPRRASGRLAAAGARNYNEKSFYSFLNSPSSAAAAASSSRHTGGGPPRRPSSCHSCRQKREEMGSDEAEGSNCWRCDGARGRFCRGCLSMRYGLSLEAIKLANETADREVEAMEAEEEAARGKGAGEGEEERGGGASAGENGKAEAKKEEKGGAEEGGAKSLPCGWLCPHCYEEAFPSHGWICNSSLCMKKRQPPLRPTGVAVFESKAAGHASVAHALQAKLTDNGRTNGGLVGPLKEGLGLVVEGETDLETVERRRAEEKARRRKEAAASGAASVPAPPPSAAAAAAASPPPDAAAAASGKENGGAAAASAKRPRSGTAAAPKSAGRAAAAAPLAVAASSQLAV